MPAVQIAALVVADGHRRAQKLMSGPADPLAPIAGRSVLTWVIDAALGASIRRLAVVGRDPEEDMRAEVAARRDRALIEFVAPRATQDSVELMARGIERLGGELTLRDTGHLLVLAAEAPQIESAELRALITDHIESGAAATITGAPVDPLGTSDVEPIVEYDDRGRVESIIEPIESESEIIGAMCIRASLLIPALRRVTPTGWRRGPQLHEAVHALHVVGHPVNVIPPDRTLAPITSTATRAPIEAALRDRVISGWIDRGVLIEDPRQVSIDATVSLGHDVQIRPGTVLEGSTVVGDGAVLGPNTHLVDATIGTGVHAPSVVVINAEIAAHERLSPFSVVKNPRV